MKLQRKNGRGLDQTKAKGCFGRSKAIKNLERRGALEHPKGSSAFFRSKWLDEHKNNFWR